MKAHLNIYFLISFIIVVQSCVGQSFDEYIHKTCHQYVGEDHPGFAVIASQGDKIIFEHAYGIKNMSTKDKMLPDDVFRIGSITKQFTGAAILKLAEEERLRLEDDITMHIPEAIDLQGITIRHLLNHTSGLGNQSDLKDGFDKTQDFEDYPVDFLPTILSTKRKYLSGQNFHYSNFGYLLLGYIIEKVTGNTYEDHLTTTFFQPLNMKSTGFEYLWDSSSQLCQGYSRKNIDFTHSEPLNMEIPYAAGGLVSTVNDLYLWNQAIFSGKVLSSSSLAQILTPTHLSNGKEIRYSAGWQIGNINGLKTIRHDGIIDGFASIAIYIPETKVFVVILSNSDNYRDIDLPATKIAAYVSGSPFSDLPLNLTAAELSPFQGVYALNHEKVTIALQENELVYFYQGGPKHNLIPFGKQRLRIAGTLDELIFAFENDSSSYYLNTLKDKSQWKRVQEINGYTSVALSETSMNEYIGSYQVPGKFTLDILKINNRLYGKVGNDQKELLCFKKDQFCAKTDDAQLTFHRNSDGNIVEVTITQGIIFKAIRL